MSSKRPKRPAPRFLVTTEYNGQVYEGEYSVEGRPPIVTVYSVHGTKATQQGNSPAETIAGMLLHQLIASFRNP